MIMHIYLSVYLYILCIYYVIYIIYYVIFIDNVYNIYNDICIILYIITYIFIIYIIHNIHIVLCIIYYVYHIWYIYIYICIYIYIYIMYLTLLFLNFSVHVKHFWGRLEVKLSPKLSYAKNIQWTGIFIFSKMLFSTRTFTTFPIQEYLLIWPQNNLTWALLTVFEFCFWYLSHAWLLNKEFRFL